MMRIGMNQIYTFRKALITNCPSVSLGCPHDNSNNHPGAIIQHCSIMDANLCCTKPEGIGVLVGCRHTKHVLCLIKEYLRVSSTFQKVFSNEPCPQGWSICSAAHTLLLLKGRWQRKMCTPSDLEYAQSEGYQRRRLINLSSGQAPNGNYFTTPSSISHHYRHKGCWAITGRDRGSLPSKPNWRWRILCTISSVN